MTASLLQLKPFCPVLYSQCTAAQWSERRLMRSILHSCSWFLQPVPPQTDTPSLPIVFKPIHQSCYPVCLQRELNVQGNRDSHNLGLALLSLPERWDGWISQGHDCSFLVQGFASQDLPHCGLPIISPSSPRQKGQSGISFPPHHPPAADWPYASGFVFGLGHPRPPRVLLMREAHAVSAQKKICMPGGGEIAWPVYS